MFRPDRLQSALLQFVCDLLRIESVSPPPLSLAALYEESAPSTPLLLISSPGADASKEIEEYAAKIFSVKFNKDDNLLTREEIIQEAIDCDGILSSMGLDVRAGFNVGDLPTKEAPGQTVNFLQNYKVGMGERITSGGGRTKAVNGILDQNTAATIQAIFGAAGSMYVSFVESAGGAMKAEDGTLAKGISAGLESLTTNSLRSARYLQPLLGKAISPTSSGEIQRALYTKRQSMLSLNKDFDVLMTRGLVHIDGRPVDGNSIIPTQDPIRQDLAAASKTVTGHINEEDERIAYQRKRLSTLENATDQGTYRQKRDKIDAIKLEIQTLKASQLAKIHQYEDHWSARLSEKYGRNIRIDLSGGYGKTIAARPNLEGSKMREFPK